VSKPPGIVEGSAVDKYFRNRCETSNDIEAVVKTDGLRFSGLLHDGTAANDGKSHIMFSGTKSGNGVLGQRYSCRKHFLPRTAEPW
jgi:hypothetical protein